MLNSSQKKIRSVVFVCTGNSCRSVMAEGIFKSLVSAEDQLDITSAGIRAVSGMLPSEYAIKVLQEFGIDMRDHLARPFDLNLAKYSDLIVVMTSEHKDDILDRFSEVKGIESKVFLLNFFSNYEQLKETSITDPIGMSLSYYQNCARSMVEPLKNLYQQI